MNTEAVDPRYRGLDTWESHEVLEALLERQFMALAAVKQALFQIESAAQAAALHLRRGGRLAYAGAGTSGRIAVQDAAELPPTFGWPRERLLFLLAGGEQALTQAVEGAEDDAEAGRQAAAVLEPADVLVGVAASGGTPYTLAALREARARGAITVALANNQDAPLLLEAHHPVPLLTGPEVIAGSTRLSAGTAQKVALNLFSTLLMVRLGRVYDNLMVEAELANQKLFDRGLEILGYITKAGEAEAREALKRAGGVSVAALLLKGLSLEEAQSLLVRAGSLRQALAEADRAP